ncbi:MAG: RagB/SusD family nutrient uptake outer membrane protein [Muribaculaceae bacterium]|nr:RagB/SusD family nutrient uptake outer membrane protein [Muribaculaceae bacterium]
MQAIKYIGGAVLAAAMGLGAASCTDLSEKTFDAIDASVYYQDENSVKGAVASIYSSAASGFLEYFWYLNEFPADQIAWRSWNGGAWGYDEAEKFVLSTHTWNSESKIVRSAWEHAWETIGLCNTLIADLESLDPAELRMRPERMAAYIAEVRTMRAWAYYNNFELWGGVLPLNTVNDGTIPGSAASDFATGCNTVWQFIVDELDDCYEDLAMESGSGATRNRMNRMTNRMLKMRLLLNSEVFTGTPRYSECATLCDEILSGAFGSYELAGDYRDIFGMNNASCPEVVFAFAMEDGKITNNNRNTPFLPYNYGDIAGGAWSQSGWNCTILVPSKDNSGNVQPNGGTDNPRSFIFDYGDRLGGVWDRMNDKDIRKQNFSCDDAGNYQGMFLAGAMLNYTDGSVIPADADRQDKPLVYVDQVGTFLNLGRALETVMSPRWGETNSGLRVLKYPLYPEATGFDWRDIDEVEFRLAEVYYTLAECRLRAGDSNGARDLVNKVRERYFADASECQKPGPAFKNFDADWMLSEWGLEFLNEGRRRRTDLRRFDKFTQGQWWFFGRASETDRELPAKRDRKYEWYPLPQAALMVNPGLIQNPNY